MKTSPYWPCGMTACLLSTDLVGTWQQGAKAPNAAALSDQMARAGWWFRVPFVATDGFKLQGWASRILKGRS
jgi:hypothetical protein